jgi:hypothetical protein
LKTFNSKNLVRMVLSAVFLLWACTRGLIPATGERRYLGFTWEEEKQMGKQAAQEIAAVSGIYDDAELDRFLEQVGRKRSVGESPARTWNRRAIS